jgi:hypothetical protein
LVKDASDRLGTEGGVDAILEHPWFADLDIEAMHRKELEPPFIPELSDDLSDVSNFDDQFTEMEPMNSVMP